MNDQKPDLYALIVGYCGHCIAAALAGQNLEQDRLIRAIALTDTAQAIFAKYPREYRPGESILQAVTTAGVYLNRFRPVKSFRNLRQRYWLWDVKKAKFHRSVNLKFDALFREMTSPDHEITSSCSTRSPRFFPKSHHSS